jgi:elongation factor G
MPAEHRFDQALMFIPLEAAAAQDRDRLAAVLSALSAEDPTMIYSSDPSLNLFWLHAASEADLDQYVTTLRATCGCDLRFGAPQVTYIEKPMKHAEIDYRFRDTWRRTFARVKLVLQPTTVERPVTFEGRVSEASMPKVFLQAIEAGILAVAKSGIHGGFPVHGVHVALIDFDSDQTSTSEAFGQAASAAFRECLRNTGVFLFEPLMNATITIPEAYEGSVTGDLLGRRGRVLDRAMDGALLNLTTTVPLANMFGYAKQLQSFTQGHGTFSMQFDRYEQAPAPSTDPPFRPAAALRVA